MKIVPLSSIFDIEYGSKIDSNKTIADADGINYVTRTSKNLGIKGKIRKLKDIPPLDPGLITVTLGGSYLLSAFVQPDKFYTAQNIKVLRPKTNMSFNEKVFYCLCIRSNRFKYSSHGREANKSLSELLVPARSEIPTWVYNVDTAHAVLRDEHTYPQSTNTKNSPAPLVSLESIFDVINGISSSGLRKHTQKDGVEFIPFIRPSKTQLTSFVEWLDKTKIEKKYIFPKHTLYVSTNGQGSHSYAYVSNFEFVPNSDVSVLIPKKDMTLQEKLFYAHAISVNRPLFSYGRKPKGKKLKSLKIPAHPPSFIYGQNLFEKALKTKK